MQFDYVWLVKKAKVAARLCHVYTYAEAYIETCVVEGMCCCTIVCKIMLQHNKCTALVCKLVLQHKRLARAAALLCTIVLQHKVLLMSHPQLYTHETRWRWQ